MVSRVPRWGRKGKAVRQQGTAWPEEATPGACSVPHGRPRPLVRASSAGSPGPGQRPEVRAAGGGERRQNPEAPAGGLSEATVPAERAEEKRCSSGRGRAAICHLSSGTSSLSPQDRRLFSRRRLLPGPATCLPCSRRWLLFQHGSGRSGSAWAGVRSTLGTQQGEWRSELTHLPWSPGRPGEGGRHRGGSAGDSGSSERDSGDLGRWGRVAGLPGWDGRGGEGGRGCQRPLSAVWALWLVLRLDFWTSVADIWAGLA